MIQDLWRDLRDKRLLPVVGLLLVALIAVPVALGGGDDAVPVGDAATAPSSGSEAPEAEPVVLVDVPAIRDYNERLSQFKRQNPFRQQYTDLPKSAQRALEEQDDGAAGGVSPPEEELQPATGSSEGSSGGGSGSSGGGSGGTGGGNVTETLYLYTWEIDVKVGPVGNAKTRKGVKQGEFLPGDDSPIVLFLGANEDKQEAVFYVSRDVESTSGEGRCAPNRSTCEFVLLKKGQEHRFVYEPDGVTYRLKLTGVKLKREEVDPSDLSAKELRKRTGGAYADLMDRASK